MPYAIGGVSEKPGIPESKCRYCTQTKRNGTTGRRDAPFKTRPAAGTLPAAESRVMEAVITPSR